LLTNLWQRLLPATREKVLREFARIVAEQLLVPPTTKREVGDEQR
jgi:hypothetical protein